MRLRPSAAMGQHRWAPDRHTALLQAAGGLTHEDMRKGPASGSGGMCGSMAVFVAEVLLFASRCCSVMHGAAPNRQGRQTMLTPEAGAAGVWMACMLCSCASGRGGGTNLSRQALVRAQQNQQQPPKPSAARQQQERRTWSARLVCSSPSAGAWRLAEARAEPAEREQACRGCLLNKAPAAAAAPPPTRQSQFTCSMPSLLNHRCPLYANRLAVQLLHASGPAWRPCRSCWRRQRGTLWTWHRLPLRLSRRLKWQHSCTAWLVSRWLTLTWHP